jgi:hypothetical protein
MAISEYDNQFAEAMKLKLKLNRQQGSKTTGASAETSEPSGPTGASMRDSIMNQVLAERPGLTRQELSEQMAALGY